LIVFDQVSALAEQLSAKTKFSAFCSFAKYYTFRSPLCGRITALRQKTGRYSLLLPVYYQR
jgi:hypothetical protein